MKNVMKKEKRPDAPTCRGYGIPTEASGRNKKVYPERSRRGFTLLEILVAAAIFALVMVFATATIARSVSSRSKLRAMRLTSEASRNVTDMLTRDIRQANAEGTINDVGNSKEYKFKNGIALLFCSANSGILNGTCRLLNNEVPYNFSSATEALEFKNWDTDPYHIQSVAVPPTFAPANVIVIFNENWTKVYYAEKDVKYCSVPCDPNGYALYYKKYDPIAAIDIDENNFDNNTLLSGSAQINKVENKINNIFTEDSAEAKVFFGGYAPNNKALKMQQPYVQLYIGFRSVYGLKNYDQLLTNERASVEIITTVTGRSYNQ